MNDRTGVSSYLFVALLFALFVFPKVLQRFRIPAAITSVALGALLQMGFGLFRDDPTIELLSTLGIVSLFLFAGLDVELRELRANFAVLLLHVSIQIAPLALLAYAGALALDLRPRAAMLVGLALLTPSTGFILDSLGQINVSDQARFWIKIKAIGSELMALAILFATLQSTSTWGLVGSAVALAAIIGVLPFLFRAFAALVLPYAPKSEFAFLMMVAVACGVATKRMGVYYLVGAFVVGMAAQRLRSKIPTVASERMLHSVESFASLFVPFYFFNAGLKLRAEDFAPAALLLGLGLAISVTALRILLVWLHRRVALGESLRESLQVGMPLVPTLVFTLVLADILRERFQAPSTIIGALVLYTILTSILPGLYFGRPLPEVEDELLNEKPSPPLP